MQVLVTGGAGVIGRPLIAELLERGHRVRLFTRHARTQVAEWPDGVEAWEGDIADKSAVTNSVNGCQVIIHIAGIARERPPDATFERINVLGTQLLLEEASATGRPRFIFISSLGADTGKSEYHASKRAAEGMVMKYGGDWRIVRPGNVYGPGDEVISSLMTMVRTFPFVPVVDDGEQQFQPVWSNDLAIALANLVERDDLRDTVMDVAGLEVITTRSLLERMMKITGREVGILPVPGALADLGTRFASMFGAELPASPDTLTMLGERNVVKPPEKNRLPELLGRAPTPLDEALRSLAQSLPERGPERGVGAARRKRLWLDIDGANVSAEQLLERVRKNFDEFTPRSIKVGVEPGSPTEITEGATLTLGLPLRGHVQVRCEDLTPNSFTLVTVQGHPLAGEVRLICAPRGAGEPQPGCLRVEINVVGKAASALDWLAMRVIGDDLQDDMWDETLRRIAKASGGRFGEIQREEA